MDMEYQALGVGQLEQRQESCEVVVVSPVDDDLLEGIKTYNNK